MNHVSLYQTSYFCSQIVDEHHKFVVRTKNRVGGVSGNKKTFFTPKQAIGVELVQLYFFLVYDIIS